MKKNCLALIMILSVSVFAQTVNYSMNFDGSSNNVNAGASCANGVRSIEFWFKPNVTINSSTSIPGYSFLVRNDGSQSKEYGIYIKGSDWNGFGNVGHVAFFIRYSGTLHEVVSNSSSWTAGTWYHVAGVIDPTSGMQLYINGVLQTNVDAAATTAILTDNSFSTYLGTWGTAATRYFNGRMDEMRFWNRAISQSEIQSKMCLSLTPSGETGLQAYWQFNEGSGSQILDATANAYNGTVNGATWVNETYCTPTCAPPVVNISGVTSICSGNGTVLTATSTTAISYTWSANAGGAVTHTVNLAPSTTTTYTLYSSDGSACTATNTITVNVTQTPTLSITGNTNICSGNSISLSGLGATSYTWNLGFASVSTQTINVSPNSSATYTLTGMNGSCSAATTVAVVVTPTPTLSISGITNICSGNGTILSGSGASNYTWSANAGSATTASVSLNPTGTTTYTLTAANGVCAVFQPITVTVTPTPTLNITGITTICSGNSTILTGGGASTYTWSANAGSVTTNTAMVSPAGNTNYILTGSDLSGLCSGSATTTVTVLSSPTITVNSQTVCISNSATLTASGAVSFTWNPVPMFSNGNSSVVIDSPTVTTTYTVSGTGSNGCTTNTTVVLTVDSCLGGISTKAVNTGISVFPNPTTGSIMVQVNGYSGSIYYKIFNNLGQEVINDGLRSENTPIDLHAFPNGIYTLVISRKEKVQVIKISLQK